MPSPDELAIPTAHGRDLAGQTALVTGATSGIGRAAAHALAALGADLAIHRRDAGRGASAVGEITDAGGSAGSYITGATLAVDGGRTAT